MNCVNCGANLPEKSRSCEYCGTQIAPPEPSHDEVFERIKQSPQYKRQRSKMQASKQPSPKTGSGRLLIFFLLWCLIGPIVLVFVLLSDDLKFLSAKHEDLVSGTFVVYLIGVAIMLSKLLSYMKVRVGRSGVFPAVVVRKHTMRGPATLEAKEDIRSQATFELENGKRVAYHIESIGLLTRLSVNDAGILILRGDQIVDFEKVTF
ncbi:hypothetical protein GC197_08280 [bacterium]|nr:hypothetical protein [bacterium]